MSGMSGMLRIALDREAPPHHEPNEKGELPLGTLPSRKAVPFHSAHCARSLRRSGWIPEDVAHAAHAFDPWVLDVYTRFGMTVCPRERCIQTGGVRRMSGMSKSKKEFPPSRD